jgi:DNA-binding SARP family transcriptional activator
VSLFGRATIEGTSEESGDGFGPKSREFLYLFLLNPDGLTREEAIEMLWPGTDIDRGLERFKFQLRKVRGHLRGEATPTTKFIEKIGDVYKVDPQLFGVDVWEFDRLLERAMKPKAIEALAEAADLYRGELLQGLYFEWSDSLRTHFQQRALDALTKLSDFYSNAGDHESALKAVLQAINTDRFAEHLYRRAMSLYAQLGRAADIHRLYRELEALLSDELEAEPDPETSALKHRLLDQLNQSA